MSKGEAASRAGRAECSSFIARVGQAGMRHAPLVSIKGNSRGMSSALVSIMGSCIEGYHPALVLVAHNALRTHWRQRIMIEKKDTIF